MGSGLSRAIIPLKPKEGLNGAPSICYRVWQSYWGLRRSFSFPQSATKESLRTLVLPLLVSHWCEDLLHLCNQFPIVGLIVPGNVAFYGFWICRAKEGRRNIVVLA
jgi:hypothetical protein